MSRPTSVRSRSLRPLMSLVSRTVVYLSRRPLVSAGAVPSSAALPWLSAQPASSSVASSNAVADRLMADAPARVTGAQRWTRLARRLATRRMTLVPRARTQAYVRRRRTGKTPRLDCVVGSGKTAADPTEKRLHETRAPARGNRRRSFFHGAGGPDRADWARTRLNEGGRKGRRPQPIRENTHENDSCCSSGRCNWCRLRRERARSGHRVPARTQHVEGKHRG